VCLEVDRGGIVLEVRDDGGGFDTSVPSGQTHMGLRNMLARAEELGGVVEVESSSGRGTRVCFRLPLSTDEGASSSAN
jgi:two-component system nitrate/nitrite sensor histidine kinase NarX